jgi:hypothetical protein
MQTKIFAFVIAGILFTLCMALAIADNGDNETPAAQNITENVTKNMTYGQCVSEAAVIKNSCYSTFKDISDSCKSIASNQTDKNAKKNGSKQCLAAYKDSKNQCKTEFKAAKKECAKIKHNFIETIVNELQ